MNANLIFWPLMAQLLLPMLVLLLNAKRKRQEFAAGGVDKEKTAMDNQAWGKPVVLTSKNLANQFQLPVLFYVLCIVLHLLDSVTALSMTLASLFVFSRYFHAYAHVTSNYVPHRFRFFLFGALMLIILFIYTLIALASA